MAGKRRKSRRPIPRVTAGCSPSPMRPYDPGEYPDPEVHRDTRAGLLGTFDGWEFELVYRYGIYRGLTIDWAIMIYARRVDEGRQALRRLVQRIDICHSQVHRHEFRCSSDPNDDQGIRTTIVSLSADDATTVNHEYDVQMALLSREWPQRVRIWIDG